MNRFNVRSIIAARVLGKALKYIGNVVTHIKVLYAFVGNGKLNKMLEERPYGSVLWTDIRPSQMHSEHSPLGSTVRDRATRLFSYLRDLAQLRSKTIRDLSSYEHVLWFADIPKEPECFSQAWGVTRENREEIWLEIKKPKEPLLPTLPEKVRPWISDTALIDLTKDEPQLLSRIPEPQLPEATVNNSQEPNFINIADHPDVLETWTAYLEQKWKPWAAEHRRFTRVQKVYSKLFSIYQSQKTLGESFETILAFGLLSWNVPSGQSIHRHLIKFQASVELDPNRGTLTVSYPADGPKPTLEQDMLDISDTPPVDVQTIIGHQIAGLADDVWNVPVVEAAARSWVQSVSADGVYDSALSSPPTSHSKPNVTFAPALILRKRTERGFIKLFTEISNAIMNGSEIPLGILRTVDIVDETATANNHTDGKNIVIEDTYFPLPANDDQRKIVEKLRTRQGVLVQGPPGTGKSHTIVNLICHLLATGQRVLITSQTPRALQVLKTKMTTEKASKDLAPLCVSLIGDDSMSLKDLENSVQAITSKYQNWDADENRKSLRKFEQELQDARGRLAELNYRLRQLRESETVKQTLFEGVYTGTLQQIAIQVANQKELYQWIEGTIDGTQQPPLSDSEALKLLELIKTLTPTIETMLRKARPEAVSLISPDKFIAFINTEKHIKAELQIAEANISADFLRQFSFCSRETRTKLLELLLHIHKIKTTIHKHGQSWVDKAVSDVLSGKDRSWRELLDTTTDRLKGLLDQARLADDRTIQLTNQTDPLTLVADARVLRDHLKGGGGFGLLGFRPKAVKRAWHIIEGVRVNGEACKSLSTLEALIANLEIDIRLKKLWDIWSPIVAKSVNSRAVQVLDLEDLCEPLQQLFELLDLVEKCNKLILSINGLSAPAWHASEEIGSYYSALKILERQDELRTAQQPLQALEENIRAYASRPDAHDCIHQGLQAITERDEKGYGLFYCEILQLERNAQMAIELTKIKFKCEPLATKLLKILINSPNDERWERNLKEFSHAWCWEQARLWLEKTINGTTVAEIEEEIAATTERIEVATGRLAAANGWKYFFDRLKKVEAEHLAAWKNAVKRIGKGTGKHAEKYRQEARQNMEACRSAIPAWIMPLYKVAETIGPVPHAFDVVIIDEASQAGPEALFLQFIAKKIVVVGDDKQISPDSVGVPREDVDRLRQLYLHDLPTPHTGELGVEGTSFFHLAEVIFGGRIPLREHFRCMPEIIRFSNDLWYQQAPLIPLRQFPPSRLEPVLVPRHIPQGYRQGDGRKPLNPIEADELVAAVKACCQSPAYKDKSMGIISLLGENQARYIENKLLNSIGPEEMSKRNIVCGDAYAFQGDERDVIFLSLVAASNETTMYPLVGQKHERRFNVAASRARDQMWLFHTPSINDFKNKEDLRFQLVSYFYNPAASAAAAIGVVPERLARQAATVNRSEVDPPAPFDSWFEVDIFCEVSKRGFRVVPQYRVAGHYIDLMIEGEKTRLAVECDGDHWHGADQYDSDMSRQRMLERCGQRFWRVRGSEYYYSPQKTLQSLWGMLDDLNIHAINSQTERTSQPAAHLELVVPVSNVEVEPPEQKTEQMAFEFPSRQEFVQALIEIILPGTTILRVEAIRAAARLLKDRGRLDYQRLREDGDIWNEFKSAVHSAIRRGILDGDSKSLWRPETVQRDCA